MRLPWVIITHGNTDQINLSEKVSITGPAVGIYNNQTKKRNNDVKHFIETLTFLSEGMGAENKIIFATCLSGQKDPMFDNHLGEELSRAVPGVTFLMNGDRTAIPKTHVVWSKPLTTSDDYGYGWYKFLNGSRSPVDDDYRIIKLNPNYSREPIIYTRWVSSSFFSIFGF